MKILKLNQITRQLDYFSPVERICVVSSTAYLVDVSLPYNVNKPTVEFGTQRLRTVYCIHCISTTIISHPETQHLTHYIFYEDAYGRDNWKT